MGDGRDREEGVKGVWSGPLFNEDPNQPSRGCPETPRFIRPEKPVCRERRRRTEGWDQAIERKKYLKMRIYSYHSSRKKTVTDMSKSL